MYFHEFQTAFSSVQRAAMTPIGTIIRYATFSTGVAGESCILSPVPRKLTSAPLLVLVITLIIYQGNVIRVIKGLNFCLEEILVNMSKIKICVCTEESN